MSPDHPEILTVPEPHLDLTVTDSEGRNTAQIAVEDSTDGDRNNNKHHAT